MRIAGVVILFAGLLLGIGSNLSAFVDPPSLIIVGTFVLGVLWTAGVSVPGMFRVLLSADVTAEQNMAAARGWGLAARSAMASGYIGTLVGAVIILRNLEDIGSIGPGVAICIMTLFYGLVAGYGLCLPCEHHIKSRLS